MVSIFTLGVGFISAVFFALGGSWNTVLGALLCLFASILDGCDGEVARLKLLESDFGCWLETVCDYLFYFFLLTGMTIGQWRSTRRCFFPYALVVFALFGIMNVAFILSVIGANLVWPITLYSSRAFAPAANAPVPDAAACV